MNVPKHTKVGEIRKRLEALIKSGGKCVDGIVILAKTNEKGQVDLYKRLFDDEATVSESIGTGKWYIMENSFSFVLPNVSVSNMQTIVGIEEGDTVLSVQLRAHDQLDHTFLPLVYSLNEGEEKYKVCNKTDVIENARKYKVFLCHNDGTHSADELTKFLNED